MKIEGRKNISSVGPAGPSNFGTAGEAPKVESSEAPDGDLIEISSQSRDVGALKKALAATPDIRMEKVEGIRDQVEEGSYHVESEKIARRIVDEHLEDAVYRRGPA